MCGRWLYCTWYVLYLSGPPPLNIRENNEGVSSTPSLPPHHGGSSINTTCSSNGLFISHQSSPKYKGTSSSPCHIQLPQQQQSSRHHSLTSPTPMLTAPHTYSDNSKHDLTNQIGSFNPMGHGPPVTSPTHQATGGHRGTNSKPQIFTYESVTFPGGHMGSTRYACDDNFSPSPLSPSSSSPRVTSVNPGPAISPGDANRHTNSSTQLPRASQQHSAVPPRPPPLKNPTSSIPRDSNKY